MAEFGLRGDKVYLIVTINKRTFGYLLRKKKPKSLAPNQIAIGIPLVINEKDWFERIQEVNLSKIIPPR